MAKLYVTEFWGQGSDNGGRMSPSPIVPPLVEQVVLFTGTAGEAAALDSRTKLIRLHADSTCAVAFKTGLATTGNMRMVAGQTEYFSVGKDVSISVIQTS